MTDTSTKAARPESTVSPAGHSPVVFGPGRIWIGVDVGTTSDVGMVAWVEAGVVKNVSFGYAETKSDAADAAPLKPPSDLPSTVVNDQ